MTHHPRSIRMRDSERRAYPLLLLLLSISLTGCGILNLPFLGSQNEPVRPKRPLLFQLNQLSQSQDVPSASYLASYNVPWSLDWKCRIMTKQWPPDCVRTNRDFIGLAISGGGGSRAAVFSAAAMFELQHYGLLQQVDVVSSVSGGSITAALYALSCDDPSVSNVPCPPTVEGTARPVWTPEKVFDLLERDFILRWFGNLIRPDNLILMLTTRYDRSDVMAKTLQHNLFDTSTLGNEGFGFHDLNPQRPSLIINSTDNTSIKERASVGINTASGTEVDTQVKNFGITRETFQVLKSDFDQYPIAYAVMASSAFPGVFHYITLKNFSGYPEYMHLYDGGASDNLGVTGIAKVMDRAESPQSQPQRRLIIAIDAYVPPKGKAWEQEDPRGLVDYLVDSNFLDAYDTLMAALRERHLQALRHGRLYGPNDLLEEVNFQKLTNIGTPEALRLYDRVYDIGTNLKIECEEAAALKQAARLLVKDLVRRLKADSRFQDLIPGPLPGEKEYYIEPCYEPRS